MPPNDLALPMASFASALCPLAACSLARFTQFLAVGSKLTALPGMVKSSETSGMWRPSERLHARSAGSWSAGSQVAQALL